MSLTIRIYGSGCANCARLEKNAREAATQLGIQATVQKVTDFAEMAKAGVFHTPALGIGDKVVSAGRIPPVSEIVSMLATALEQAGE